MTIYSLQINHRTDSLDENKIIRLLESHKSSTSTRNYFCQDLSTQDHKCSCLLPLKMLVDYCIRPNIYHRNVCWKFNQNDNKDIVLFSWQKGIPAFMLQPWTLFHCLVSWNHALSFHDNVMYSTNYIQAKPLGHGLPNQVKSAGSKPTKLDQLVTSMVRSI